MFLCSTCIYKCKGNKNSCQNYEPMVDEIELEELRHEVRRQNLNIRRFCKKEKLKQHILKDMLNNKIPFSDKYLSILNSRLNEKDWVVEFLEKHPTGFNEDDEYN